ncbi:hypothetical protein D3C76_1370870 [compost metagenome]
MLRQLAAGEQLQVREQRLLVGIRLEQRQQVGMRPQRGGAQVRLEDRLVLGIHEGHGNGADFQQRVFVGFRLFGGDGESDLNPGHRKNLVRKRLKAGRLDERRRDYPLFRPAFQPSALLSAWGQ